MIPKNLIVSGSLSRWKSPADTFVSFVFIQISLMSLTMAFRVEFEVDAKRDEMPRDSVTLNDSKQPVKLSLKGFYDSRSLNSFDSAGLS